MVLRLAKFLNTSPGFWLNLQLRWDLFHEHKAEEQHLKRISPMVGPSEVSMS